MKTQGYIKLISSVGTNKKNVLELNILPGEKTPWHYHSLFSETFDVLKGLLEVGKGNNILHLKQGDIARIEPNEQHYYHNVSNEECIITTTIEPGNKNFENSLFILKGLANDGVASDAGTPRKFSDLAIFVYLNNSRLVGIQKIAAPIFNWAAKSTMRNGHLNELIRKYSNE